jgi:hypothetical protein
MKIKFQICLATPNRVISAFLKKEIKNYLSRAEDSRLGITISRQDFYSN